MVNIDINKVSAPIAEKSNKWIEKWLRTYFGKKAPKKFWDPKVDLINKIIKIKLKNLFRFWYRFGTKGLAWKYESTKNLNQGSSDCFFDFQNWPPFWAELYRPKRVSVRGALEAKKNILVNQRRTFERTSFANMIWHIYMTGFSTSLARDLKIFHRALSNPVRLRRLKYSELT